ncbi:MAG TPA: hypothetical protein VNA88_11130 [Candidatus Kapabacteria bacterium]|jgi:hypothetical protein|nr:hypothetical protein [Candidatus Kapabacteria bacterium]
MKALLLGAALLLTLALPATAQKASMWKHLQRPDAGASLRFMTLSSGDTSRFEMTGIGAIGGFNLPFLELGEDMSLGFNPNIVWGYYLSTDMLGMSFEIPAYITFKWGTDATWGGSKSWVGTTLGLGYDYNVLVLSELGIVSYGIPSLMAEVNFGKRRGGVGLIKLRYSMGLGGYTHEVLDDSSSDIYNLDFTQYGFDLIITSGY